jgi:hypothetical protein
MESRANVDMEVIRKMPAPLWNKIPVIQPYTITILNETYYSCCVCVCVCACACEHACQWVWRHVSVNGYIAQLRIRLNLPA